jgi:hypothetical protein
MPDQLTVRDVDTLVEDLKLRLYSYLLNDKETLPTFMDRIRVPLRTFPVAEPRPRETPEDVLRAMVEQLVDDRTQQGGGRYLRWPTPDLIDRAKRALGDT